MKRAFLNAVVLAMAISGCASPKIQVLPMEGKRAQTPNGTVFAVCNHWDRPVTYPFGLYRLQVVENGRWVDGGGTWVCWFGRHYRVTQPGDTGEITVFETPTASVWRVGIDYAFTTNTEATVTNLVEGLRQHHDFERAKHLTVWSEPVKKAETEPNHTSEGIRRPVDGSPKPSM
jgi:hypothetical protein